MDRESRVGAPDQLVVRGTLSELSRVEFGPPLHSLVLVGRPGVDEKEMLECFATAAGAAPRRAAA